jgi:hypothetical protein
MQVFKQSIKFANGVYSRFVSFLVFDLVGMICNDRLNSNPENTVGILTMAGNG